MWGSVLVLALLTAPDPVRLGFILLLISRPRPIQNLLAYWAGGVLVSFATVVVPLLVLHYTPISKALALDVTAPGTASDTNVGRVQIGMGVFVLLIATAMAVRLAVRQRAHAPAPGGAASTLVLDPETPAAISWLAGTRPTAVRRLLGRAHRAWDNGSIWVAFVVGFTSATPPIQALVVLTPIVASGAAIGTQVCAALVFVVGTLAIVETVLVSYLAWPAKTKAVLSVVHNWVRPRQRQVTATLLAVVGMSLLASGLSNI